MKYQLRCPKCNHEFAYDNGYYDRNIERLGMEIAELTRKLAEHRLLPWPEQKRRTEWWLRTKKSLAQKQEELAGLKAIRKVADQQVHHHMFQVFKNLVKEQYGEAAYQELLEKCKKEVEAYTVSGLMRHEYTKSNAKEGVTSINKIL